MCSTTPPKHAKAEELLDAAEDTERLGEARSDTGEGVLGALGTIAPELGTGAGGSGALAALGSTTVGLGASGPRVGLGLAASGPPRVEASGPRVAAASGPRVEAASGPRVDAASGPRVEEASGPRVEEASGPRVEEASGPRVEGAWGPRVEGAWGPRVGSGRAASGVWVDSGLGLVASERLDGLGRIGKGRTDHRMGLSGAGSAARAAGSATVVGADSGMDAVGSDSGMDAGTASSSTKVSPGVKTPAPGGGWLSSSSTCFRGGLGASQNTHYRISMSL